MRVNWWNFIFSCTLCNLVLIRFCCISRQKFRSFSKFFISLTHWYAAKLRAILPNTNYFKSIILKLKTFIYNSNNKIICNFCIYGGNTPPRMGNTLSGGETFYCSYFVEHSTYSSRPLVQAIGLIHQHQIPTLLVFP